MKESVFFYPRNERLKWMDSSLGMCCQTGIKVLHLSIYLWLPVYLSIYLYIYLSIYLLQSIYLSIYFNPSIYLSIYFYLSIYLLRLQNQHRAPQVDGLLARHVLPDHQGEPRIFSPAKLPDLYR